MKKATKRARSVRVMDSLDGGVILTLRGAARSMNGPLAERMRGASRLVFLDKMPKRVTRDHIMVTVTTEGVLASGVNWPAAPAVSFVRMCGHYRKTLVGNPGASRWAKIVRPK